MLHPWWSIICVTNWYRQPNAAKWNRFGMRRSRPSKVIAGCSSVLQHEMAKITEWCVGLTPFHPWARAQTLLTQTRCQRAPVATQAIWAAAQQIMWPVRCIQVCDHAAPTAMAMWKNGRVRHSIKATKSKIRQPNAWKFVKCLINMKVPIQISSKWFRMRFWRKLLTPHAKYTICNWTSKRVACMCDAHRPKMPALFMTRWTVGGSTAAWSQ